MSKSDPEVVLKLQLVLQKLSSCVNPERKETPECCPVLEDDTTLQKLHTYMHDFMKKSGNNDLSWAHSIGLLEFIHTSLDVSVVNVAENASIVAFAIKIFGSLLSSEGVFDQLAEDKILMDFYIIWPNLRNDPTLSSAALDLLESLLSHKNGRAWLLKNEVWEKLLLPSLRSTSIFVQRKGVMVIASLLLKVIDTQDFEIVVKDLLLVSDKFGELHQHVDPTLSEEIRQSNLHVLLIFKELYQQTLGKVPLYSKIREIGDLRGRLLSMMEPHVPVTSVMHMVDVVFLDALHNFQEKIMEYGIIEQFLVDTLCTDVLALVKLLFEKGHMESYYRSSMNVHKYWNILVANFDESKRISLGNKESLIHLVTCFQIIPVFVLCKDPAAVIDEKKTQFFNKWTEEIHCRIDIKEALKEEALKLEDRMKLVLLKDPETAIRMTIISISATSNAVEHLNPITAVLIFQGATHVLCITASHETSIGRYQFHLQKTLLYSVKILVEKFEIDWRKCYVSICMLFIMCELLGIRNSSVQIKVLSLSAMRASIEGFIPPVMSMLVDSQHHNSIELMGQVLTGCLVDMEWEVRDSALEVLITCMTLAKDKYPFFVDWLLRFNLDTAVLAALEDMEGYVRASAFTVLACFVSIPKVWVKVAEENLQHRALIALMRDGETPVRKAASGLVTSLFSAGKYSEDDVDNLVVNVMQRSTEDVDDEVRWNALEFIQTHIKDSLHKAGMVDGEFPAVTFSRGKITKLDKKEVQKRVMNIITWICNCGYLNCLLLCLNDAATNVAEKAQQICLFLNDLIKKYDIRIELHNDEKRGKFSPSSMPLKRDLNAEASEIKMEDKPVTVVGKSVEVSGVIKELEDIDRTITDILRSSTIDNVSSIKRPPSSFYDNTRVSHKDALLTTNDVPLRNASLPVEYLLQSIGNICRLRIAKEMATSANLLSLLDDVLLEGCKTEADIDGDDQHLRDCY